MKATNVGEEQNLTCLRHGGLELTLKAVELAAFTKQDSLADIGCGSGLSVNFLQSLGYQIKGVDKEAKEPLIKGDAESLPFENSKLDGLLYECSFSKMKNPKKVLWEAARVLKDKGILIVSDFYARGESAYFQSMLGRVETEKQIQDLFQSNGFILIKWQDVSDGLAQTFGQLIFEHGSAEKIVGSDREKLKKTRCGYFLSLWRKNDEQPH